MEEKEILLTQEGYDKLESELENLRTEKVTRLRKNCIFPRKTVS